MAIRGSRSVLRGVPRGARAFDLAGVDVSEKCLLFGTCLVMPGELLWRLKI